ncbi:MAG: DnaA/Hda family protein [Planctomycetota bacterium]
MSTQRSAINARINERLAQAVGQRKYELWIQPSVRVDYEDAGRVLHVAVPNRFVADKVRSDFSDELREAARAEAGVEDDDELRLDLCIAPDQFATPAPAAAPRPADDDHEAAEHAKRGAPRNPRPRQNPAAHDPALAGPLRHRFEDFVVGPANELAYAAAASLVEVDPDRSAGGDPASGTAGPLFVYGECGMGKTHLLQAACRRTLEHRPDARVLYTTGEQFTNAYITAVRTGKLDAFRRSMRRLDLLAVDDIEFLANKDKTQQEFLHSFSHIELAGSRVILASDSHPKLIKRFSEGLVSRCVQGLVVQVQAPDQPTRLALINRLTKRRGLVLQPGLDERVAALAGRSVREIEGTLAHLHALASLAQPTGPTRMVNRALVEKLVAGQNQLRAQRPVRFADIRDTVCERLNVPAAQVAGSSRHRLVVLARAMLIHLTRQMTTLSFPEIAAALGKPSHSTVVTASQRMSRQLEDNRPLLLPGFAEPMTPVQLIEDIRRQVLQNLSAA